ncbi:substrate-binding domain-containing protein [Pseudoflavitalea sp. X16]|uniref:hybrid sensor histidine kinase/response regulator transcription factor n=1 Tax=Paraflavitalea devenefica TaxID=2716334 RepID=UPI00141DEF33|nr:substrate-binding domain-containing protein [Paraflavitalea devenefica]NII25907.1 substrate-binding domain-containing protein [Paraflavitalea devenefica]
MVRSLTKRLLLTRLPGPCIAPLLVSGLLLLLLLPACTGQKKQAAYTIGFSQCIESDAWRRTMLEGMKKELAFHPGVQFIYRQANGNSQQQEAQVKELLQKHIDLLIISPNEAAPLTPVVEEAFRKGIPVIVVDRKIATPLYTAYVGGDNYEIGKMAGQYAVNLLNGKGKIIEITGLPKSSPAIERRQGFADAIKNYPGLQIIRQVNGEWLQQTAQQELAKIAPQYPDVNLVFAHNDMMSLGTYEVYKNSGLTKPYIIGVDGLPATGMKFVAGKMTTATMLYPTGGEEAIRIAMKILNKENVAKENLLQTTVIDSTNVRIMQLQAAKTASQQQQIERQQSMLKEQQRIYNNQRTLVYILVLSLILSLILGGLAFYSLRENRKISKKLQAQNQEILDHQAQLVAMSEKAKAANEAKVNFFTNISHEFRTPLTLILGPMEELLANSKNSYHTNQTLGLIQKNVIRLLRLVNQLMDFRKIEVDKMKLRAAETDLITFTAEIIQSYKSIAQKRNIDLRLITKERQLLVWMDITMLDKVIFNLLSNAFKFTKDNGYVHIYISKNEPGSQAIMKIEDNGVGMSKDAIDHAFDVFYQGEYENYKGSGLGLALSKELIGLHKGTITVSSEKWKGTRFEISLPLGNAHLEKDEMTESVQESSQAVLYEHEKIYTADLKTETSIKTETEESPAEKTHTVLIIEDNADLRQFLVNKLSGQYEILEADNGQYALQQAFDYVPDLIICDVVIPGKDGMALTHIFKNDVRTSHIPVVLLTAKTAMEQQIEGMKNRADAYITKPFNVLLLQQTIKSLLDNRARLKEHFTGELPTGLKTQTISKPDRKFINEFSALVESNLSNEDFTVETICKHIGISRVQLYRKVKALLNVNVNDYILNTRLQKAKYFLKNEDTPIGEIASKTGFSSSAYFSSVFKTKVGITPKEYREK